MLTRKFLKVTSGLVGCFAVLAVGTCCYQNQKNKVEEPVIFDELYHYDTLYDFSKADVLMEQSDLVVVGKLTSLEEATNYNAKTNHYGKARTPGNLEVIQVLKDNSNEIEKEVHFADIGGVIAYPDYEKSLLPAQREKREYLMKQNGVQAVKANMFVKEHVENQLELEVGKTYIMYFYYNPDLEEYIVINQPYGVKEYNTSTGEVYNHVTKTLEKLTDIM